MTTSTPVYTSKAEGFRPADEIAALRPIPEPKPARPRKKANPALRQVTNGIVCFCGERFGEADSLEFMLHLRAEVGEDLGVLERIRKRKSAWQRDHDRERRVTDPEWAERRKESKRRWAQRVRNDPEASARLSAQQRERRATPEYRARQAAQARERRARRKAEREAAGET